MSQRVFWRIVGRLGESSLIDTEGRAAQRHDSNSRAT